MEQQLLRWDIIVIYNQTSWIVFISWAPIHHICVLVKKLRDQNIQKLQNTSIYLCKGHVAPELNFSCMKLSDMHSRIVGAGFSDRLPVPCLQGECEWTRHRKQGVYFLRSPWESSGDGRAAVSYSFTFEPSSGDIKMDFSIESQWWGAIRLENWLLVPFTSLHCLHFGFIFNIAVVLLFWQQLLKSCNVTINITKTDQSSVF